MANLHDEISVLYEKVSISVDTVQQLKQALKSVQSTPLVKVETDNVACPSPSSIIPGLDVPCTSASGDKLVRNPASGYKLTNGVTDGVISPVCSAPLLNATTSNLTSRSLPYHSGVDTHASIVSPCCSSTVIQQPDGVSASALESTNTAPDQSGRTDVNNLSQLPQCLPGADSAVDISLVRDTNTPLKRSSDKSALKYPLKSEPCDALLSSSAHSRGSLHTPLAVTCLPKSSAVPSHITTNQNQSTVVKPEPVDSVSQCSSPSTSSVTTSSLPFVKSEVFTSSAANSIQLDSASLVNSVRKISPNILSSLKSINLAGLPPLTIATTMCLTKVTESQAPSSSSTAVSSSGSLLNTGAASQPNWLPSSSKSLVNGVTVCPARKTGSPVYFTFVGPPDPLQPPEATRYRQGRYGDVIGPLVYDMFQDVKPESDVWLLNESPMEDHQSNELSSVITSSASAAELGKRDLTPAGSACSGSSRSSVVLSLSSAASTSACVSPSLDTPPASEASPLPSPAGAPRGIPSMFYDRVRSDIPMDMAPPTMRQTVTAVRRLMRKRMHRCSVCKNRFIEKDLFERHMKERHLDSYEKYLDDKARREEQDRIQYLQSLAILKEIEEKKNKRLEYQYERTIQINTEREKHGLHPLEMEEIFPPRPKRPRLPSPMPPPQKQLDPSRKRLEDGEISAQTPDHSGRKNDRRKIVFKKRICPQCPFCDKRYRTDQGMRKHIARKHPDCINYVQCNKCYKVVKDLDKLTGHECDLTWICLECTPIRNMVTAERLFNHKRKFHRGERSGFQCFECQKKFLTPRKLRKHQKYNHVHTRNYKCHFCDEYFTSDLQVSLHERIHTGKIRFECNICDYKCNRFIKLGAHKREDHGYLCMRCGEKVMEWNELKNHTLEAHEGYLCVDSQAGLSKYFNKRICFVEKLEAYSIV